jgi:probable rRNA maturation factor
MPVSVTTPRGLSRLAAPLRALVLHVLRAEGRVAGEVGVVIAGDALLRELNRSWRGQDHATDVISFAYDEHERDAATRPVCGDLLVSLDRAAAQATRYRVSPGRELARLVVHGTLHLCGHDHMRAAERARMRAREDAALRRALAHAAALDRVLAASGPSASRKRARANGAAPRSRTRPPRRSRNGSARRDAQRRAR